MRQTWKFYYPSGLTNKKLYKKSNKYFLEDSEIQFFAK